MKKKIMALLCAIVMGAASAAVVYAEEGIQQEQGLEQKTVLFYGTVTKTGEGENQRLTMKARVPETGEQQEIDLNISERTLILNASDGLPVALSDIHDNEMVYAYVSPAMTMSLPPQCAAYVIFTKIPSDSQVPSLEEVKKMTMKGDQSAVIETVSGKTYQIPSGCTMTPYFTRNIVSLDSLSEGTNFLVWSEKSRDGKMEKASKIMVFQRGQLAFDEPSGPAEEAGYRNE